MTQEEHPMSNENAELIRRAYQAYASGDLEGMLELVDPELEWTYLDPALEHPTPQVCHGRQELEQVLRHWAEHGLRAELEEVTSNGELVMVGVRTPGMTPISAEVGLTASTACSRCARDGSSPCATAATGTRPSNSPASRPKQPPLAVLRRPQRR
jgi:ketosteroid isomerase-like protein